MLQTSKEIDIPNDNIFVNDKLDRKESIQNLSNLLESTHEPFVLSIDASWGAGKTTFVKMWKAYLEKELEISCIYFSAWEDDFSKEPLISIMGELNTFIVDNFSKDTNVAKKFNELKNLSGKIIRRGLPALVKGATSGVLDIDSGFESAVGAVTESVAKELIESYEHDKAITVKFKERLHEIIERIDSDKPLVIFIDELDRCRPLYAIELLERIKHIFGIEKLIFVLSIDKEQLSESIKSQYGNIDSKNYLRRFIDLEYSLQRPNLNNYISYLISFYDLYTLFRQKKYSIDKFIEATEELTVELNFTLRETEHLIQRIYVIILSIRPATYNHLIGSDEKYIFDLITLLLVIKIKFPEDYDLTSYERLRQEITSKKEQTAEYTVLDDYIAQEIEVYSDSYSNLEKQMKFALNKVELSHKFSM